MNRAFPVNAERITLGSATNFFLKKNPREGASAQRVASIFGIKAEELWGSGKHARMVPARSVFCYWAVRELGMRETEIARKLKITQPGVSISVRRGEQIAREKGLVILGK